MKDQEICKELGFDLFYKEYKDVIDPSFGEIGGLMTTILYDELFLNILMEIDEEIGIV